MKLGSGHNTSEIGSSNVSGFTTYFHLLADEGQTWTDLRKSNQGEREEKLEIDIWNYLESLVAL